MQVMKKRTIRESLTALNVGEIHNLDGLIAAVSGIYGKQVFLEPLEVAAWGPLTAFLADIPEGLMVYYRLQDWV